MHGYVKYPLPTIPAGCTLNSATIHIANAGDYYAGTSPLYVHPAAGPWRESKLTWRNQPGPTAPAARVANPGVSPWIITRAVAALYSNGNTGLEVQGRVPDVWWAPNSREYLARYGNQGIPYLFVSWH